MRFKYVAYSATGDETIGTLEAESEHAAEQMLWQNGLTILDLKKQRQSLTLGEAVPSLFGIKRRDVIAFSRDLSSLLQAGIAIVPAVRMLRNQTGKAVFRKVLDDIMASVETGSSFSQACARHRAIFQPLYFRLLQVGEEIGNLELVLRQVSLHMEKEQALKSKIRSAMVYPSFLVGVTLVTVFVLINFVLPAMSSLLKEFGGQLPLVTRILMAAATIIRKDMGFFLLGVSMIVLLLLWYVRTPAGSRRKDALLLRMPVISNIVHRAALTGLVGTLKTLLAAGVSLTEAFDMVINTTTNSVLRDNLVQVRADVHSGQLISQAMATRPIFPPLLTQMMAVGEQTGTLESSLATLESYYEEDSERQIKRLLGLMEPALILVVGGIVGFVAVSVISPIYGIIQQIK